MMVISLKNPIQIFKKYVSNILCFWHAQYVFLF